ncbi:diacylglycerol kinase family protein [Halobacteriovorax sp. JY17]|uniref:diacylglycerol/lipid kinase family protein n=1 Tax=Halobacteriovorax sp. JY17 TaxID=2014617 RepID=UPI0025C42D23|nr:diacylglycerol kinase family protein [Halobacteriovorax sp. JY17]
MQNISVYLNQRASHTQFGYWKEQIDKSLFRSTITYRTPRDLDELKSNLQSDIDDECDAIVSVGGDGTVNTLIQSLAGKEVGLLVMPGGTANDLACELGHKQSVKKVTHFIRNNEYKYIDLIKINNNFMATNGGLGMGSKVAERINEIRRAHPSFKKLMKLGGKSIYSFFILSELTSMRLPTYKFKVTSEQFSGIVETPILMINNQPHLAGTFNIAPNTRHDDGKFNVTILKHKTHKSFVQCCYKMAIGEYPFADPDIISFETDAITIENMDPTRIVPFFGDGEIFQNSNGNSQKWDIQLCPRSLKVYTEDDEKSLVSLCNEVNLS